jgi:HSP90 family molecular chaperone
MNWKRLKKQKVTAKINMTAESKGDTTNPNIIAEIQGKKDSKVIVLGAQLDSWDLEKVQLMTEPELYSVLKF